MYLDRIYRSVVVVLDVVTFVCVKLYLRVKKRIRQEPKEKKILQS